MVQFFQPCIHCAKNKNESSKRPPTGWGCFEVKWGLRTYVVTTTLGPERGNQKNQNVRLSYVHTHLFVSTRIQLQNAGTSAIPHSSHKSLTVYFRATIAHKIWPFQYKGAQKLDKNGGEKKSTNGGNGSNFEMEPFSLEQQTPDSFKKDYLFFHCYYKKNQQWKHTCIKKRKNQCFPVFK